MEQDKLPNYKIYFFKDYQKLEKEVIEKFYAENDDAAYAHLVEVKNTRPSYGEELYYATINYTYSIDSKGNRSPAVDIDELRFLGQWIHKNDPWIKRLWESTKDFFEYWLVDKPRHIKYWTRDLVYLLKNKEAYSNQWNLDWHLLDSIERNVPSLIENSHSLAFIDEAIVRMHGRELGFDLAQWHKDNCYSYPKDLEDLAVKIQNREYSKLLLRVKLYKYYSNFGVVDFSNPDDVMFDKKWRRTLPIKKGTYDEISDYSKAMKLAQDQWNAIWDWMKAYGQRLND